MNHLARFVVAAICATSWLARASATTWVVDPAGPLASIQTAIDGAQPGDLVQVRPGWYYERLVLRDGVSVEAEIPGSSIVEAEAEGTCVTAVGVGVTTAVSGLVFQHGSAHDGGGLYGVATSASFTDCTFVDCGAVLGGGAYLRDGSRASFVRCTFADCAASVGGGLYLDFAAITLTGSVVRGNEATDGGAIAASNAAEAVISTTSFFDNVSRQGSTVACNLASPRFTNCTLAANTATLGTFGLRGSGSRIDRCIVAFNTGGAIACVGFSSPWVGCSILYGNGGETVCAGDQGTNLNLDPLFCDRLQYDFTLAANSPAAGGGCGSLGALPVACAAQGVETAVRLLSWTHVKDLYRD